MQLWNSFHQDVFMASFSYGDQGIKDFYRRVWQSFGGPVDEYPGSATVFQTIKGIFLGGEWWRVFDILETALSMQNVLGFPEKFAIDSVNKALSISAYVLQNSEFTERLPIEQTASIDTALSGPFSSARTHFANAYRALNRRPECDAGEVIRESIHGVEATCRELCSDQNADLGRALAKLDKAYAFHPALKQAIEKLYAWTGDESGVRHALKEAPRTKAGKAEAQLAVVTCSAIANYLIAAALR
jgi:hypothetical protein